MAPALPFQVAGVAKTELPCGMRVAQLRRAAV